MPRRFNIAVFSGDGIGPEVMAPTLDILHRVSEAAEAYRLANTELPLVRIPIGKPARRRPDGQAGTQARSAGNDPRRASPVRCRDFRRGRPDPRSGWNGLYHRGGGRRGKGARGFGVTAGLNVAGDGAGYVCRYQHTNRRRFCPRPASAGGRWQSGQIAVHGRSAGQLQVIEMEDGIHHSATESPTIALEYTT